MARCSWRAPYSLTDWLHDAGSGGGLPCPRCGHDEDYGLRDDAATATPENVRYYRASKVCGMFQEADGRSDPYETTITVHLCLSSVAASAVCRGCGIVREGRAWHLCPRILAAGEAFTCPECDTNPADEHTIPWAAPGPWT